MLTKPISRSRARGSIFTGKRLRQAIPSSFCSERGGTRLPRGFFENAIGQNVSPETVTIDKSGANLAALNAVNAARETPIKVRQVKYLNNNVEQDHRAIKRQTIPMLGFKDFNCARVVLRGIELMHMIKKGQVKCSGENFAVCRPAILFVGFVSYPSHITFA